jgi:hypothetical protein
MVIEFLTAEGSSPIKIHRRTRIVYGEDSEYVSSVRRWVRRFKSGEKGIGTGPQRFSKEFNSTGVRRTMQRRKNCVDNEGDVVEKIISTL